VSGWKKWLNNLPVNARKRIKQRIEKRLEQRGQYRTEPDFGAEVVSTGTQVGRRIERGLSHLLKTRGRSFTEAQAALSEEREDLRKDAGKGKKGQEGRKTVEKSQKKTVPVGA